jgi:hypothetical protein
VPGLLLLTTLLLAMSAELPIKYGSFGLKYSDSADPWRPARALCQGLSNTDFQRAVAKIRKTGKALLTKVVYECVPNCLMQSIEGAVRTRIQKSKEA